MVDIDSRHRRQQESQKRKVRHMMYIYHRNVIEYRVGREASAKSRKHTMSSRRIVLLIT